jgi:hypothetical protein
LICRHPRCIMIGKENAWLFSKLKVIMSTYLNCWKQWIKGCVSCCFIVNLCFCSSVKFLTIVLTLEYLGARSTCMHNFSYHSAGTSPIKPLGSSTVRVLLCIVYQRYSSRMAATYQKCYLLEVAVNALSSSKDVNVCILTWSWAISTGKWKTAYITVSHQKTAYLYRLQCSEVLRQFGMSFRACSLLQIVTSCWNNLVMNRNAHNKNNRLYLCINNDTVSSL